MRVVLQRVTQASVTVDGECVGKINAGWLVLLGIAKDDSHATVKWMVEKCINLRAFEDTSGKMNLSVQDIRGEILVVSQFTLYGDCNKGRRPSFDSAAPPEIAESLYVAFCQSLEMAGMSVSRGRFRADMKVHLVNDGPVTLILER